MTKHSRFVTLVLILMFTFSNCEKNAEKNHIPIVNAGSNQTIIIGDTVQLDGSGSSDEDGDNLTYNWSIILAPDESIAILSNAIIEKPTFVPDFIGVYNIQLIVNDGVENSQPSFIVITVQPKDNMKPIANAGENQTIYLGNIIQLDGSESNDTNGDSLTFNWSIISAPDGSIATFSNASLEKPTFTPDIVGEYTIQLIVNDGTENSDADIIVITVYDNIIYGNNPFYSPDGNKIAFNTDDIFIMDSDGSNLINLTNGLFINSEPSFSPNSQKIAFSREIDDQSDIYIMNIDGTDLINLTNTPDSTESSPSWSPSGDIIVFTSDGANGGGVFTINIDGTNRTYLTNVGGTGTSWYPNSKILYVSGSIINNTVSDDIFICSSDGTAVENLSYNTQWDENPCWSPDGTKIVFDSGNESHDIYIMNNDGSNPINLTNDNSNYYSSPTWSPDGMKILFIRNNKLYIMNSDGTNMLPFKRIN